MRHGIPGMRIAIGNVATVRYHRALLDHHLTIHNDRDTMSDLHSIFQNECGLIERATTCHTEISPKRNPIAYLYLRVTGYLRHRPNQTIRTEFVTAAAKQGFAVQEHIHSTA